MQITATLFVKFCSLKFFNFIHAQDINILIGLCCSTRSDNKIEKTTTDFGASGKEYHKVSRKQKHVSISDT